MPYFLQRLLDLYLYGLDILEQLARRGLAVIRIYLFLEVEIIAVPESTLRVVAATLLVLLSIAVALVPQDSLGELVLWLGVVFLGRVLLA